MTVRVVRISLALMTIFSILLTLGCDPGKPKDTTNAKTPVGVSEESPTATPISLKTVECSNTSDEEILDEITTAIHRVAGLKSATKNMTFKFEQNTFTISGSITGRTNFLRLNENIFSFKCVEKVEYVKATYIRCSGIECPDGSCKETCEGIPKETDNTNTNNNRSNSNQQEVDGN